MQYSDHLENFVEAQDSVWPNVVAQLQAGRKRSHWMWFVFPQLSGLGTSEIAKRFAISSLNEAEAYMDHAVLGERLRRCTALVLEAGPLHVDQIFGYPDDLKFRSCMTLFSIAAPHEKSFREVLDRHFAGVGDPATLRLLEFRYHVDRRQIGLPAIATGPW